ncbi:MAG TPA: cell division protein FtsA [Candidatus Dormibacteraeota bacterium]|nr:cell division protein FtsA [Candidatus Dormibacteraeota bacterium]
MSSRRLVALDLGTAKVCCAVADDDGSKLRVIGVGEAPSAGVRKGVIIDPDAATQAISQALDAAERSSGVEIDSALMTLSGRHIQSQASQAVVSVTSRGGVVGSSDLNRVLEGARSVPGLEGQEVVHLIPRDYQVDAQAGLRDPRGTEGGRLSVDAELVLASSAHLAALVACVHAAGLRIDDVVVQPLASAEGVLRDPELEAGVAVVDIGAGTTNIAIFQGGTIRRVLVLPVGGQNVTNDLATGLRCDQDEAETLKCRHGHCDPAQVLPEEMVTLVGSSHVGAEEVPRRWLAEIIEPRAREMARLIGQALDEEEQGLSKLVVTGGGFRLRGFAAAVHQILEMPVRLAVPEGLSGLADQLGMPEHAAAAGLLRWGQRSSSQRSGGNLRTTRSARRLNRWLHELF